MKNLDVRISEERYRQIALVDPEGKWELDCGMLQSKPPMTYAHNHLAWLLGLRLQSQLDIRAFEVRVDAGRVRRSPEHYYIPDVMVIPVALTEPLRRQPQALEIYSDPLPLVVEVWSPSTGGYDIDAKLPEYQRRGDAEIWRIHPFEQTLTAWRRQPDGSYAETRYRDGTTEPAVLPGVQIDLKALFET